MAAGHEHPARPVPPGVSASTLVAVRRSDTVSTASRARAPGPQAIRGVGAQHQHRDADPRRAERGRERLVRDLGIREQQGSGSRPLGVPGLDAEQAAAPAHQSHGALGQPGEGAPAAAQPRRADAPLRPARSGVGEQAEVGLGAQPAPARRQSRAAFLEEGKAHGLQAHGVARLPQPGAHVGHGRGIAGRARRPVAAVLGGDLLQRAQVLVEAGGRDGRRALGGGGHAGGRGRRLRALFGVATCAEDGTDQGEQGDLRHPAQDGRAGSASAHAGPHKARRPAAQLALGDDRSTRPYSTACSALKKRSRSMSSWICSMSCPVWRA